MISIFLDTNVIFSREDDFSKALFGEKLTEIIDEIESNDLYENVQIFIPQIVIDELQIQQVEKYEEAFSKIKNIKFHNFDILYDKEYKNQAEELFESKLDEIKGSLVRISVLPYPQNETLKSIIKRAVLKKAPFEGRAKESDKGFKDVILWETILQYKREHATDTVILFSGDGRICDVSLEEEYRSLFNDTIFLIKKDGNLKNKDLFGCIEDLTNKKIKPLFSKQIELRLLSLMTEENIEYLFINDTLKKNEAVLKCVSAKILSREVTQTRDKIEDERIKFTVNVILECVLKSETQSMALDSPSVIDEIINSDFEVDYCFSTDTFYIREYDTVNKGRVVFRLNNIELEQNFQNEE
jgi:hypothetical protein